MRAGAVRSAVMVACLLVLAWDASSVPVFSAQWWLVGYPLAAFALLGWHVSGGRREWLSLFVVTLGSLSAMRALILAGLGDRWSGAALNLLLALIAVDLGKRDHLAADPTKKETRR